MNALQKRSKDIRVGDIVFIREDEEIRADVVLLKSSNPEGFAYIEVITSNREKNLIV